MLFAKLGYCNYSVFWGVIKSLIMQSKLRAQEIVRVTPHWLKICMYTSSMECVTPSLAECQCWPRSMSSYVITRPQWVNSLVHGGCEWYLEYVISNLILVVNGGMYLMWNRLPSDENYWKLLIYNRLSLVQVMTWYHQVISHCLSQYWPSSV